MTFPRIDGHYKEFVLLDRRSVNEGEKLFDNGTIPAAFTLIESSVSTTKSGVIIANYKRAGKVKTGTVGA